MTDEKLNVAVEEKECNCPVCKFLKSDCLKKFTAVTLAFIYRMFFSNTRVCA